MAAPAFLTADQVSVCDLFFFLQPKTPPYLYASPPLVPQVMRLRSQGAHGASFLSLDDKREVVNAVADNALAAFIIIHAALRRSVRLAR
jgi:acetate kinase